MWRPRLVPLPDQRGVMGRRIGLGGVDKGRVPAQPSMPVTRTPLLRRYRSPPRPCRNLRARNRGVRIWRRALVLTTTISSGLSSWRIRFELGLDVGGGRDINRPKWRKFQLHPGCRHQSRGISSIVPRVPSHSLSDDSAMARRYASRCASKMNAARSPSPCRPADPLS